MTDLVGSPDDKFFYDKARCNDPKFLEREAWADNADCRPRSDCSKRSSLIRVFTVCLCSCILLANYPVNWPVCSNFIVFIAKFSCVRKFWNFTVFDKCHNLMSGHILSQ